MAANKINKNMPLSNEDIKIVDLLLICATTIVLKNTDNKFVTPPPKFIHLAVVGLIFADSNIDTE